MKTYYFKQLKSGNYKIATAEDHTHKTSDLVSFFNQVSREKSNTFSAYRLSAYRLKEARIIKATYSQSQTYFQSAAELVKALS